MADNNKINQAKDAARRAARQASKTTEIAILHFDGGCSPASMRPATGFTTDVNVLLAAIDKLQPGGGTPMYIATAAAVEYAQKHGRGKQRTVVLMSDGGDSCRDQQAQAAASIRASNIPVSTIGFDVGNNQQAQGDLGNLATMTGGRTFSASAADPREIIRAFNLAMLPSLLKDFDFGNAASNVAGYFSQAKAMVQQQNVSGALMLLQQANQLAPNSPNLNFNLSLLYESEDQLIPAMNHANNYLRLAPTAIDRADVENRIAQMQKELQANPRVVMDSSGCRDVLSWAQAEQDVAKRGRDVARRQGVLEVLIAAQRGECENARKLQASYKQRFGGQ
jgi:tetratricopeptide (TPR) repeat protein